MNKLDRRTLLVLARILISVTLITYLLFQVDTTELFTIGRGAILSFLLLAILLEFTGVCVKALRWWWLLRTSEQQISYAWTLRTYLIGQFFSNFLPTMVGGDAVRIYRLNQRTQRTSRAFASVFIERITGFVALTLIAMAALGLSLQLLTAAPQLLWGTVWCIVCASGALGLALAATPITRRLTRLQLPNVMNWRAKLLGMAEALSGYYDYRRTLLGVIGLSFVYQFVWIGANYAVARALHMDVPLAFMALMVPVVDIVGMVPIFFNNLGAREAIFALLLSQLGTTTELALVLSFLVFIVRLTVSLLGGLLYLMGEPAVTRRSVGLPQLPHPHTSNAVAEGPGSAVFDRRRTRLSGSSVKRGTGD